MVGIFGGAIVSAIQQAAELYSPSERKQPDVFHMQLQFFHLILPGEIIISVQDVSVARSSSIVKFAVSQESKDCVVGHLKYVILSLNLSELPHLVLLLLLSSTNVIW